MLSSGIVVSAERQSSSSPTTLHSQTVMSPAIAPIPKVVVPDSFPLAGLVYESVAC